jgi:hypothetical protein
MPNLKHLLKDTMLGTGAGRAMENQPLPFPIRIPAPEHDDADDEDVYESNPIWYFENPTFAGTGVQVENVSCKVRSMKYMKMPVLRLIEWGPVVIRSSEFGEVSLPLTEKFRLINHFHRDGSIKESTRGYWQLKTEIDQGFEMIFGYEIVAQQLGPSITTPTPMSLEDCRSDQLMPEGDFSVVPAEAGTSVLSTLRIPPLRIIVVVSLVCCKERYNFVAGNVLGAARIYPLLFVVASSPIETLSGSVSLTRPAKTPHRKMDGDIMTAQIGCAMYADRNDVAIFGGADWDNIFDYYFIDPPNGSYTVVHRWDRPAKQVIAKAVTVNEYDGSYLRSVTKVAGQGEFDNLHIAPKMVLSDKLRNRFNAGVTGDAITMAPFCIHDCLHVHWRWSADFDDPFSKGWVGHVPFAKAGAPLVPSNQEVKLDLTSPTSVRYTATAENPVPGQWQIVMHHGCAYGVSASNWRAEYVKRVLDGRFAEGLLGAFGSHPPEDDRSWANVYWELRYVRRGKDKVVERLRWTSDQFDQIRGK